MDIKDNVENLTTELTCSVCLDYFTKPVTIDCGHSFCKECPPTWEEAPFAEHCKMKLRQACDTLWRKACEAQILLDQERRRVDQCKKETLVLKQVIIPEYLKMSTSLTKKIPINMREFLGTEARFSQYIQNLKKMIDELEKNSEKPLMEMLLDVRSALERSEVLLLQCPEPATLDWTNSGMREILLTFQRNITLNPETVNSNLIFSEDLKSVKLASVQVGQVFSVLGAQRFVSGCHYWEVEVGGESEWEVGIYRESANKKGKFLGDVLSLMSLKVGEEFILWISHTLESIHSRVPVHKLGIFFHYDCGHISFYNVADSSLIYRFPPIIFQGPVCPFFSLGLSGEENNPNSLTICPLNTQC
ncbi:probable E3 ubiquitin-protein ligase TRIML1 [Sarcophilus harrisii]|uniref:probable E3 ubiquitin-protein ligase TRIML1 n=1 Tax=Sarcophilus harrisii TaxID=9305 RepID=UPI001301F865|nr:probable E3 ubiquitin-protein ligase TRIML1 [Sarcophilus harrisii]